MTYEHNESHFFDVVGINQIKTHSYLLANKAYDGKSFHADLLLNLTYFDSELKENFINLSLPIDISIDDYCEDFIEVKNVELLVVENQGINLDFTLEIILSDKVLKAKQKDNTLTEAISDEVEKELIKEEYQATLEEVVKSREGNVCISEDKEKMNLGSLKTSYRHYRLLFLDDEKKLDTYSSSYQLSMQELYQAKKHNQRLIIDVDENFI